MTETCPYNDKEICDGWMVDNSVYCEGCRHFDKEKYMAIMNDETPTGVKA